MGTNQKRVRTRIIFPFSAVMAMILLLFAVSAYSIQQYHLNREVDARLKEVSTLFTHLIQDESKYISGVLGFIGKDAQMMKAWQDRDREELYRLASPLFKDIKGSSGITHFYFIDPDKRCFLRVHGPDRYGYIVRHHSLKEASSTQRISSGIELGRLCTFTLRVVHPYVRDGRITGYIELGKEIEHITPKLKEVSGLDLVFTIDKTNIERERWEYGIEFLGKVASWEDFRDFVVIDTTIRRLSPQAGKAMEDHRSKGPAPLNVVLEDRTVRMASTALFDVTEKRVGSLIAMYDITDKIRVLRSTVIKTSVFALGMILILFVFYYRFTGRIEKELLSFHHELERLVEERTLAMQRAMDEVRVLKGFLPICSHCKKIRDDEGYWSRIESYISRHSEAKFTHGICPECMKKHFPEEYEDMLKDKLRDPGPEGR